MRWLVGVVLLLLALGTLRVVGCGDDGPECLYPSHATGTVRDPTCDDENECTEGRCSRANTCDNYAGFRDGQPCDSAEAPDACSIAVCDWDRCEITEKPCEVVPHEECGDVETYYCDPDTGVVECTLDTYGSQGQDCCLEYEFGCSSGDCVPFCCRERCVRSGYCIDGDCVDGNGYPNDCTDRDDARPCEVGDTIGLCWKGDCSVLDCTGLSSGTRCWFYEYIAGECGGPSDGRCFVAPPGTGGPPGWTCSGEYYGTGDGCDCGCGVIDPDCADGTVASCDYCALSGSCNSLSWCEYIDPTQNWLCSS